MVYRNTEKVYFSQKKKHPVRILLAIFHCGTHLTRTPFKSWALKQPATISYAFSPQSMRRLDHSISGDRPSPLCFPPFSSTALVAYIEMREERPKLHQCLKVRSSGSSLHSRQGRRTSNRKTVKPRKTQLWESNTFLHFVLMGQQKKDALDAAPLRSEAN